MNLQPTEPPKSLRVGHRRCMQVNCGYYQQGYCQSCDECKARPYEINESCTHCLNCEGKPGYLRFGDKDMQERMEEAARQHVAEQQPDGVILIYDDEPIKRKQEEEIIR